MPSPQGAAYRLSIELRKMIEPPRAPARMRRAAAWAPKTWAFKLRRSMRSQPSSVTSSHTAQPPAIEVSPPALFTQTSSVPNVETAASPTACRWGRSVTSPARTNARRPSASISARSCSRSSRLRAVRTTSAPWDAKASAMARPSPRLAPVTTQLLPARENMSGLLFVLPSRVEEKHHVHEEEDQVHRALEHRRGRSAERDRADQQGHRQQDHPRRVDAQHNGLAGDQPDAE